MVSFYNEFQRRYSSNLLKEDAKTDTENYNKAYDLLKKAEEEFAEKCYEAFSLMQKVIDENKKEGTNSNLITQLEKKHARLKTAVKNIHEAITMEIKIDA